MDLDLALTSRVPRRVAVIGGGPAGIATARYLLAEGLQPVVFEQSADLGGQWNVTAESSAVWCGMRANTSRVLTSFSDLDYPEDTPTFPTAQQVHAYLLRYARQFGVTPHVRLETRVDGITRTPRNTWTIRAASRGKAPAIEEFSSVIVASGRYARPSVPRFPGLETFRGSGGAIHSADYDGVEKFRGRRVMVVGNNISALEICSDLAMGGAARVISAFRQPRYIVSKLLAGRPCDTVLFSRFASLASRALPVDEALEGLRQQILQHTGNPAQYGAPRPAESLLEAKISMSQHYLPLIAEGKIITTREPVEFLDDAAVLADGSTQEIDAVIFATGYDVHLPFLGSELRRQLNVDRAGLDLYRHTFHPDAPGLAFAGLFAQIGPYFPVLELQARWIAMAFAGARPLPSRDEMMAELGAYAEFRQRKPEVVFHDMALMFAASAGVAPDINARPHLAKALLFGPLAPAQFRLDGRDALPEAEARFLAAAQAFTDGPSSPELDEAQRRGVEMLAAHFAHEPWLQQLAQQQPPSEIAEVATAA